MFSISITKKSIVLQQSQQTLLQQKLPCHLSGSSGSSSSRRKSQSIYCTCNHTYVFLLFFSIIKQKGKYEDEAQLAQFLCFIPTYFQEIYRVTGTAPDIGVQQKPPYRCSGLRFSGSSGFSKRDRNLLEQRHNLSISLSLFLIINQSTTMRVNFYIYITKERIGLQQ